ncbi:AAA family ATPase [Chryseobacterium sp. Leaf201]|uniref:AAA family ATPase n=1 Tax=Chryseobacterium sp. Leaf201 TaxID=1735672 RepID=UPI0006F340AF|nr:ATP-binding protein [Chryseobacterium sp. Leaf201]KQM56826.1 hypothetical protein ASE55_19425 [Chryseobacterium sp. Leaf201]
MLLNTINNKILKAQVDIQLHDFTVLTGENGSGKTQLLKLILDNARGFNRFDVVTLYNIKRDQVGGFFPLMSDSNISLQDVVYSSPGLKSEPYENENLQPLIEIIKQQWYTLEPTARIYGIIRHKEFNNDSSELIEIQAAMDRYIKFAVQTDNENNPPKAKIIEAGHLQQLKALSEKSGKPIDELYLVDFIIFYPIPLGLFSTALDMLFHQFELKSIHYPLLTTGVRAPIDVFNDILEKAQFRYKAEYTVSSHIEYPLPVRLIDIKSGTRVDFQSLSSGETTVLALIFALYNSENKGHFPQVILFDEPDAHLHPSLTKIFLDVIQDVLVKDRHVKIILTTHSPSTVALAPEESIYCMERDLGYPTKMDKRTAINILGSGMASLTIEESNLGITYNIKKENKHILFTEGITDKINIETAWNKLYPDKKMDFYIQDCFSASFLGTLFNLGDDEPDGIFYQFNELKMIGLFDFDEAGYTNWNRVKKFPNLLEENPRKGLTRSNGHNGFLMLLPVPDIPEIEKQVISNGNNTYKQRSYLTIESLFFEIPEIKKFFIEQSLPGGGVVHLIGDKNKKKISGILETLPAEAFKEFIPLFEKIEWILTS